jgi:hypothetical protein
MQQENKYSRDQKSKINPQSPKTEVGLQNQYGMIFIRKFMYIIELNNEYVVSELNFIDQISTK